MKKLKCMVCNVELVRIGDPFRYVCECGVS